MNSSELLSVGAVNKSGERVKRSSPRNVVFAAPADDPRARRPVDVAILVVSALVVGVLGWTHHVRSDFDVRLLRFFGAGVPGWLSGIATVVFGLGGLYVLGLMIGIAFAGHGRSAIVRDMVIAALVGGVLATPAAYLAGPEFPDFFPEFMERDGTPSYPVIRLAMCVAAIRVVSPYLSVPMRRIGMRLLIGMSVAALVLSYGTLSAVLGAIALGLASAATVHLVFGSGEGIPSRARIIAALGEIGLDVVDLEYLDNGRAGVFMVGVHTTDDDLLVKMYGRDAAGAAVAIRLWRAIWYRGGAQSVTASSEQLAEHECFILLTCERAGLRSQYLVGSTKASTGDVLVATRRPAGHHLSELHGDRIDDVTLDAIWSRVAAMHAARITHGAIEPKRVIVDGQDVMFVDLDEASIVSNDAGRRSDRVQTLVTTAIKVGDERAVAAARRNLGDDLVEDLLPYVQTAALSHGLQHDARAAKVKIGRLRMEIANTLQIEAPEPVELHRVSWKHLLMGGLTLFAAYSLISSLTDIGFDTIAEQLSNATVSWLILAFTLAQLTNVGEYFSLSGVMGKPIPFGPTMMFRYALSFISLAVPSNAGEIAMNIRYQQKLGVPAAAAVAQGPLLTLFSKGFDILLLLMSAKFLGNAIESDSFDVGPVLKLLVVAVGAAVVAVGIVLAIPKLRARSLPKLQEGFGAIKGSLTDPERLFKVAGGTLLQKILFALALAAVVASFGSSLRFGEAIFVNSSVNLFVGLVPVPGGIGVAEATLAAALIAVGVPADVAASAAITHRMFTSYIPPVFGWWAQRWLTGHDYL